MGKCDHQADLGKFMEFILATIYDTLCEIEDTDQEIEQVTEQVKK